MIVSKQFLINNEQSEVLNILIGKVNKQLGLNLRMSVFRQNMDMIDDEEFIPQQTEVYHYECGVTFKKKEESQNELLQDDSKYDESQDNQTQQLDISFSINNQQSEDLQNQISPIMKKSKFCEIIKEAKKQTGDENEDEEEEVIDEKGEGEDENAFNEYSQQFRQNSDESDEYEGSSSNEDNLPTDNNKKNNKNSQNINFDGKQINKLQTASTNKEELKVEGKRKNKKEKSSSFSSLSENENEKVNEKDDQKQNINKISPNAIGDKEMKNEIMNRYENNLITQNDISMISKHSHNQSDTTYSIFTNPNRAYDQSTNNNNNNNNFDISFDLNRQYFQEKQIKLQNNSQFQNNHILDTSSMTNTNLNHDNSTLYNNSNNNYNINANQSQLALKTSVQQNMFLPSTKDRQIHQTLFDDNIPLQNYTLNNDQSAFVTNRDNTIEFYPESSTGRGILDTAKENYNQNILSDSKKKDNEINIKNDVPNKNNDQDGANQNRKSEVVKKMQKVFRKVKNSFLWVKKVQQQAFFVRDEQEVRTQLMGYGEEGRDQSVNSYFQRSQKSQQHVERREENSKYRMLKQLHIMKSQKRLGADNKGSKFSTKQSEVQSSRSKAISQAQIMKVTRNQHKKATVKLPFNKKESDDFDKQEDQKDIKMQEILKQQADSVQSYAQKETQSGKKQALNKSILSTSMPTFLISITIHIYFYQICQIYKYF